MKQMENKLVAEGKKWAQAIETKDGALQESQAQLAISEETRANLEVELKTTTSELESKTELIEALKQNQQEHQDQIEALEFERDNLQQEIDEAKNAMAKLEQENLTLNQEKDDDVEEPRDANEEQEFDEDGVDENDDPEEAEDEEDMGVAPTQAFDEEIADLDEPQQDDPEDIQVLDMMN